jgi:hypothetical protein
MIKVDDPTVLYADTVYLLYGMGFTRRYCYIFTVANNIHSTDSVNTNGIYYISRPRYNDGGGIRINTIDDYVGKTNLIHLKYAELWKLTEDETLDILSGAI